jgi:hypothetical protein
MKATRDAPKSALYRCLCLALLLGSGTTAAQEMTGCRQSNGTDAAMVLNWPQLPKRMPLNEKCWISFEQLKTTHLADVTWIDVRPATADSLTIEGTLAISLGALANSASLKDKRLVLIGDGYDRLTLDRACTDLAVRGFYSVSVLLGGAPELLRQRAIGQRNIHSDDISPQEFWSGSLAIPWRTIAIGLTPEQIQRLPQAPAATFQMPNDTMHNLHEQLLASISHLRQEVLGEQPLSEPTPIILIAADTDATQQLRVLLEHNLPTGTLWLSGGLSAYESYIQRQLQISAHSGRPLISPCG